MPHTHHSHSGQFCKHATDSLSDIMSHMVNAKQMTTIALTEHIGRPSEHLYPDELSDGWTPERLYKTFDDFLVEAKRLREQYSVSHPDVQILIGFEGEWIDEDPDNAERRIQDILGKYQNIIDLWIGSIHHVHGEPIDYDAAAFERALTRSGGDEDELFCAFFDAQYDLITRMKPPIIGHFDLIRLKTYEPDKNLKGRRGVWPRVVRNLKAAKEYEGVLEVNTSGLRKALAHPYPRGEILEEWTGMGGLVVLSDDSHGISHVGACYSQTVDFLKYLNIDEIGVMRRKPGGEAGCLLAKTPLEVLQQHPFWTAAP